MKNVGEGAAFTAFLLLTAACFMIASFGLTPVGRLVPLWVAGPTAALLVLQLRADIRASAAAGRLPTADETRAALRRREHGALGWTAALFALLGVVGIPLGSAAFVAIFLRTQCGTRWRVSLPTAIATGLLSYGAIVVVLGKSLWAGTAW
ncbi:MAG: hypothetical protein PVJ49_00900 [Acidobacteriota bacterium]